MPERLVTVATYSDPLEAHMARGRLEAEGIRVFVAGEEANSLFAGSQNLGVTRVQVADSDAPRAVALLAELADGDEVDAAGSDAGPVWLCPLCGEAVADTKGECPYCKTPRGAAPALDAIQKVPGGRRQRHGKRPDSVNQPGDYAAEPPPPPLAAEAAVPDPEIDVPPLRTMVGDEMARRALRASLFGFLMPPLFLYAGWQLLGLLLYPGELSPAGLRDRRLTLLVLGALLAAIFFYCSGRY